MSWFSDWNQRRRHKARRSAGFAQEVFCLNGVDFPVRELSVAERLEFRTEARLAGANPLAIYAWLLVTACEVFKDDDPLELCLNEGPALLQSVGDRILVLSGMATSESDQAEDLPAVDPELDIETDPGTAEDAKKN